jgi:F420-dependent oxidoreductase-like protein
MAKMHFGVNLPQIKRSWSETRAMAEAAESLGYDSVWFNDHIYGIPTPQLPILEAWTALPAVAAVTSRVQLGTLVSPVGFRNPALLAKSVGTVEEISGGRTIVGLGGGWYGDEFTGYGIDFPPVKTRLEQLEEAVVLMRRLWSEEQVTFEGKHFHTRDVYCAPKPAKAPPILLGGGGEKVFLRICAEHADIWNNLAVNQEHIAPKIDVLKRHCDAVGRDPAAITISQQTMVVIGSDDADAAAKVAKAKQIFGGHLGKGISGTPEQCADQIQQLADLGCTMLIIEFFGRDPSEPAKLFAETVMPRFK